MKKFYIILAFTTILFVCERVSAQVYVFIWNGDKRIGLSVGAGHGIGSFKVQSESGYIFTEKSTNLISPTISFFYGMEHNRSGNFAFGFNDWMGFQKVTNKFVCENATSTITSKQKCNILYAISDAYCAYYLNDDMSINFGAGFGITFDIAGDINNEVKGTPLNYDHYDDPESQMDMSFDFIASLGYTYNISDQCFASLHCNANLFNIINTGNMGFKDDTFDDNCLGYGNYFTVNSLNFINLVATIGFKW